MALSVIAFSAGMLLGLLAALGALHRRRSVRAPSRAFIELFRGTPLLVQILFIHFAFPLVGVFFEPFVSGALALALNSAAYLAEIYRAGIESIDRGHIEAGRSIGLAYGRILTVVVLPQAFRRVVPALTNEFVSIVKNSSLVATVGVLELVRVAQLSTGASFNASMFSVVGLVYVSITLPLTFLVRRLEVGLHQRGSSSWLLLERERQRALRRTGRRVVVGK